MADEKKRSEDYWAAVIRKKSDSPIHGSNRYSCRVSTHTKEYELLVSISEKLQLTRSAVLRLFLRYLYDNPAMAGAAVQQRDKEAKEKQEALDKEKKQREKDAEKAEKALDKQVQKIKDSNKKDSKNDSKSKRKRHPKS